MPVPFHSSGPFQLLMGRLRPQRAMTYLARVTLQANGRVRSKSAFRLVTILRHHQDQPVTQLLRSQARKGSKRLHFYQGLVLLLLVFWVGWVEGQIEVPFSEPGEGWERKGDLVWMGWVGGSWGTSALGWMGLCGEGDWCMGQGLRQETGFFRNPGVAGRWFQKSLQMLTQ